MMFDGDTFELDGLTFKVHFPHDSDSDAPWDRGDGHGPVTDWTMRDKAPGERVLASDRPHKMYYDFAEACKLALKDGWGITGSTEGKTKKQIAAEAAEEDFKRLQDWCENRWSYVGVVVTLLDSDGDETKEQESVWGIESDCDDYLEETAKELAGEIAERMEGKNAICTQIRKEAVTT